ncbi:MAG TPA: phosphoribosylformylglycinamidine synthase subunit PurQ [Nitrososphaeraceae archaeon]|jgi:phosphoribosylformylglycinamidine synthase
MPRVGILVFPGSNCERDVFTVLSKYSGLEPELIWHTKNDLSGYDAFIVPGGFTYGDSLRAGAIAAHSPVIRELKKIAEQNVPVLGICNGFQILVESNLLPGALTVNSSHKFVCKSASLVVENNTTPFTTMFEKGESISIPVAHGQGRYVIDNRAYRKLERNNQIIIRYAYNDINGSMNNVAAVSNEQGNIVGMMPHPERAISTRTREDVLPGESGVFESLRNHLLRH